MFWETERYDRLLSAGRDAGLLVMRAGVGAAFIYIHGLPKLQAGPELWGKLGAAMGNLGIHFLPAFWGFMSASAEFGGGLCLLAGFLTRPAAAVLAFNMLVAATMHLTMGQGLETASHAIEIFFFSAGLVFTGAGRYSLDQQFFKGKF